MDQLMIRREKEEDYRSVEHLIRESFWNVYRPGCVEHYLIHCLREDPGFVPELDLVMEMDGRLIGQNVFMKGRIQADDGREIPVLSMGPICIAEDLKRQGYGKVLLEESLRRAKALGYGAICIEGNYLFYGKCGFRHGREFGLRYEGLPEGADDSFFLVNELISGYLDGVTGVYGPCEAYYCADQNPEAFEAFEAQFPPKEKLKLPGQLV
jgi:predicted N-acetyltransferase YhbS